MAHPFVTIINVSHIFVQFCLLLQGAASCTDEYACLAVQLSDSERLALEAIRTLHAQLDDDANGNIDLSESDEVCLKAF